MRTSPQSCKHLDVVFYINTSGYIDTPNKAKIQSNTVSHNSIHALGVQLQSESQHWMDFAHSYAITTSSLDQQQTVTCMHWLLPPALSIVVCSYLDPSSTLLALMSSPLSSTSIQPSAVAAAAAAAIHQPTTNAEKRGQWTVDSHQLLYQATAGNCIHHTPFGQSYLAASIWCKLKQKKSTRNANR